MSNTNIKNEVYQLSQEGSQVQQILNACKNLNTSDVDELINLIESIVEYLSTDNNLTVGEQLKNILDQFRMNMLEIIGLIKKHQGTSTLDHPEKSVQQKHIADYAVSTMQLAQYAVTGTKIYPSAIQTAHIQDGNVTKDKLDQNLKDTIDSIESLRDILEQIENLKDTLDEIENTTVGMLPDIELSLTSKNAIANKTVARMLDGLPPTVEVTNIIPQQLTIEIDEDSLAKGDQSISFLCIPREMTYNGTLDTILGDRSYCFYKADKYGEPTVPTSIDRNHSYLIRRYDDAYDTVDGLVSDWKMWIVKEIPRRYSSYLDYISQNVLSLIEEQ